MTRHRTRARPKSNAAQAQPFMFCTGIENSYPNVTDRHGHRLRRDGMELSGHYRHWRKDVRPVNEIFVCARFSAELGWWNEQQKSDRAFVTALKHMCRATVRAEESILKVRADACFVQSESSSYFHQASPASQEQAEFLNQKRFLALDLCYGHDTNGLIYEYLPDNRMSRREC